MLPLIPEEEIRRFISKNNGLLVLNKQTKEPRIFGSLPIMCKEIIELDIKKLEYENDTYRIVKRNLERGGKKNKKN